MAQVPVVQLPNATHPAANHQFGVRVLSGTVLEAVIDVRLVVANPEGEGVTIVREDRRSYRFGTNVQDKGLRTDFTSWPPALAIALANAYPDLDIRDLGDPVAFSDAHGRKGGASDGLSSEDAFDAAARLLPKEAE